MSVSAFEVGVFQVLDLVIVFVEERTAGVVSGRQGGQLGAIACRATGSCQTWRAGSGQSYRYCKVVCVFMVFMATCKQIPGLKQLPQIKEPWSPLDIGSQ